MRRRHNKPNDPNEEEEDEVDDNSKNKPKSGVSDEVITQRLIVVAKVFAAIVLLIVSAVIYFCSTRFGHGKPFPVQSLVTQEPLLDKASLKVVASLQTPPGNIAVSSDGTIYFNLHPEYSPSPVKVARLLPSVADSRTGWVSPLYDKESGAKLSPYEPFPSKEFQSAIVSVLSMRIDRQDRLWLLDYSSFAVFSKPTIYAINLETESKGNPTIQINYTFPSLVAGMGSMLNDFQVDPSGRYVYIVDNSPIATTPALVVYDSHSDSSYRILNRDPKLYGRSVVFSISGIPVHIFEPFGFKVNVDSVALSRDGETLYFGALTGSDLYSIATSKLIEIVKSMSDRGAQLASTDEDKVASDAMKLISSEKPITDGITTDNNGNIWLSALERSSIAVAVPSGDSFTIKKVVENSELLRWPDGFSFGPGGLYITCSALHIKWSSGHATELVRKKERQQLARPGLKIKSWSSVHGPFHILRLDSESIQSLTGELPPAGH